MKKGIQIAKAISANLQADASELLTEHNMAYIFEPLEQLGVETRVKNTLICAIIYSYDNESTWADLNQDGETINRNILRGLKAEAHPIYEQFIGQDNEKILEAIGYYLDSVSDWRFVTIRKHIDYHSRYIKISENDSEFKDLAADKKNKAREDLGKLMREAVNHRKAADALIVEVQKDYVKTEERVRSDFGTSFIDNSIKRDIYSWRQFIFNDFLPSKKRKEAEKKGELQFNL